MKVFLDANVFVDVLVLRENRQFTIDAAKTISALKSMPFSINAAAISIPILAYVIKGLSPEDKKLKIKNILEKVDILPSHKRHVDFALKGSFADIEDAMQYACAKEHSCDLIITRDVRDFKGSEIPVMTPSEFLAEIG